MDKKIPSVRGKILRWPQPCKKTPARFFEALRLDIMSIPGIFMSKKRNALWHLKYVCPKCSEHRKKFRDPSQLGSQCMWTNAWRQGYFNGPKNFGLVAWILYYLGIKIDLTKYRPHFDPPSKK